MKPDIEFHRRFNGDVSDFQALADFGRQHLPHWARRYWFALGDWVERYAQAFRTRRYLDRAIRDYHRTLDALDHAQRRAEALQAAMQHTHPGTIVTVTLDPDGMPVVSLQVQP